MRRFLVGVLCAGAVLLYAAPAQAHALLKRSDPANGAELATPPDHVTIEFTEPPDPRVSVIRVVDSGGSAVATGPTRVVPGRPRTLTVTITGTLPNDVYTVTWRTVSRADGHVTGGTFAFGVGKAPPVVAGTPAPRGSTPRPTALAVTGRWLLYSGLALLLGAALTALLVLRAPLPRRALLYAGGAAAVAGSVLTMLAEQHAVGAGLTAYLKTSHGTLLVREAALCALTALAALFSRRPLAYGVLGALAAAALGAHAFAGHAGAALHLRDATIGVQWLHLVAVTAWMGALAWALAVPPDAAAARRLSRVATVTVLVVAVTGTLRAVAEVSTWHLLVSTGFGRTVLAKVAVFAVLLALGARNKFVLVPAGSALSRTVGAEVAFGAVAFALTGILAGLAPARLVPAVKPPGQQPVVVTGNDFATSVKVRLTVTPGGIGANTFTANVTDYDTGRPVGARRVALRFSLPARPDLRTSTLELARTGDIWTGHGPNLSVDAPWHVVVVVDDVEVPLTVTPALPQETLRADRQPGQATIYTATLPDGSSVQTYLDPDVAGFTEVHVTCFDPSGTERRITTLQVTVTTSERAAATKVRRFGPGHFVADTTLTAGTWHVSFRAVTATGDVLRGYADVDVRPKEGP